MNIVKADKGVSYEAAGHHGGIYLALQSAATEKASLAVNLSHFDPGGGCDPAVIPAGMTLCYFVVKGQLSFTVTGEEPFTLQAGDSVLWAPGDERGFVNDGDQVADLLVVIVKEN
ncbi:MAG: cupin domain-containing protein [Clostridiales Family XIII bacterium]|jgi:quercetin dioxygenase-like cupin family protein|nr:cupin domain-containing protein [Clostridiales Family XIII bacterium]